MIRRATDPRWVTTALESLDALLVDHAHCEKKAAATALSLVASYPDEDRLVQRMSGLAIEELRHFRAVYRLLRRRGVKLSRDGGDPYVQALMRQMRHGGHERMIDRLLVAGVIEARSHERLGLLAGALRDSELAAFYASLAEAESGHAHLFVKLARELGDSREVARRLEVWLRSESEILAALPLQPRIH
ncbi:MAG: tRNA-(ms[2]io[6]A)-hydroxylase [Myxococcota bacterium]